MKTVFVTGGTKNSGWACAERFAKEGYQVAISSRHLTEAEEAAAAIAGKYGVKTKGYELTLTDVPAIRAAFADMKEYFGGIDALVCVAANLAVGISTLSATEEDYDAVMDVNIKGTFFCVQEAARMMKEQGHGGAIVLFSSVQGFGGMRGRVLYGTSKGAINNMIMQSGYELAEYGIRVNAVVPGAIRTTRWDNLPEEEIAVRRKRWPLGLESTPEDVANAVWFLASDAAHTITGTTLAVDSGCLACLQGYDGGENSEASLARKAQDVNIRKGIK